MLLMTLMVPWAAAQQALPYSYGFEDNDLSTDGWTMVDNVSGTGINSSAQKTGSYGFKFYYGYSDQYLISPELTGATYGVTVSFYMKNAGGYDETFKVGYSTTSNETSAFTWGTEMDVPDDWTEFSDSYPAGTKYVAVRYTGYDQFYWYIDDFSFTAASSCAAPTNAVANYTSGTTATVTWDGDAKAYNIDVNGTITNDVSSPYVLNVTPATTYTIKVQANCGGEQSGWVNAGTFTTDCPTSYSIPYTYGFETAGQMNCWNQIDTELTSGYFYDDGGNSYAHTGKGCYYFSSYNGSTNPQYLVSPLLSNVEKGLHVEFWYRKGPNGTESFKAGYTTSDVDFDSFDPDDFVWDTEVTALTDTYQQYKANYPAGVKYFCVQYTGADSYYVFLDDFTFEEAASCLEPTGVTVSNETTTGATISWTAGGTETEWDIFVTDDSTVVPDAETTPTVANTTDNPYNLTGLTAASTYYVYVRAICEGPSAWTSAVSFNTECYAMSLPYSYNFNTGGLTVCWNIIQTNPTYTGWQMVELDTDDYALMFFRGTSSDDLAAVLPEVDANYPLNGYQISFNAVYYNGSSYSMTAGKLGVGIMTDPDDFSTFELIEEVDITEEYNGTFTDTYTVMFNNYTGSGQYIAISDIFTSNGYVIIDNIEVTELPACIPPTNVTISGGANAVVTWEGSAASYQVAYSTNGTVNPDDYIIDTEVTTTSFDLSSYVTPGDNYVWVRSNCDKDHSVWVDAYLDLSYCTPNPTSHDGSGITGVSFGTGSYVVTNGDGSASLPATSPFYGDYTSMIGAVNAGVEATIAITTGTGSYPYTFVIWVDLDKDYTFEDEEVLYVGKASAGNGTLNATITVPATQALDDYRMRIYGADSYFTNFYNNGTTNWTADHDPCNSGSYRHAHDYTLRVLEAPSCLAPSELDAIPSTTSAELSWTANSGETEWTVYYKKASDTDYTKVPNVTDNPYTLDVLLPSTNYEYYVEANCSSSETSDPSSVYHFSTVCEAITISPSVTIDEDFESYTGTTYSTSGVVPTCWVNYSTSTAHPYPHIVDKTVSSSYAYVHGGNKSLNFVADGGKSAYVALPEFTNDWSSLQVSFWMQTESNSSNYKLSLGYITAADVDFNTYQVIEEFEPSQGQMTQHTVYLKIKNVPAEAKRMVFRWTNTSSSYYSCCIDDVLVRLSDAVLPVGTLTYSNVQSTSVKLSWDLIDVTQDLWYVQYATDENFTENVGTADADTNENFLLEGLTAETHYYVRVCAQQEFLGYGLWSNTVDFETMPACSAANVALADITHHNATVTWDGESDDDFTVYYREAAGIQVLFEEGFEDATEFANWTLNNCVSGTNRSTETKYTGDYGFKFSFNGSSSGITPPQHLISPDLSAYTANDVVLSFYYTKGSSNWTETFKVGWSSTTNDPAEFTWDSEITATSAWENYSRTIPAGTKYISIAYTADDQLKFFVDDIVIGETQDPSGSQTVLAETSPANITNLTAGTKYEVRVVPNCNPSLGTAWTSFNTVAGNEKYFLTAGDWATTTNWMDGEIPTITDNAIINANVSVAGTAVVNNIIFAGTSMITVESGASLTINGNVTNGGNEKIYVRDGGQLIHKNSVNATVQKGITAPSSWKGTSDTDGWYLVATPVSSTTISSTFAGTIDLFKYDEATAYWWSYNNGSHTFSYMYRGTGYLNACQYTQTVNYAGSMISTEDTWTSSTMSYTSTLTDDVRGFNLMGNPFTCNVEEGDVKLGEETNIAYLTMNDTRTDFVTVNIGDRPIKPGEGFFIQATAADQTLVFNPTSAKSSNNGYIRIVAGNENGSDNAYINLANGNTIRKFNIANGTKVYVINEGQDFAAARVEELAGSMPVHFKAVADGNYTITVNAKNLDVNTMLLFDNFTGETIDLLENPSYTFKATTNDEDNRFKLIFDCNNYTGIDENFTGDIFAYQYGNEIIVNGEGTLEVFDVMGRMVLNTKVNGVQKVNVPANAVYIFKLMGETVKTQKIVVR